jgi:hypothetical protein
MGGWSLFLPLLKRLVPLQTLARAMWTDPRWGRSPKLECDIVRFSFVLARLRPPRFRSNCLERSLLAYRFLAQASADPHLVIAVSAAEDSLIGHAWVTIDGRPVHDSTADTSQFVSIAEFGPRGLLLEGSREATVSGLKNWV